MMITTGVHHDLPVRRIADAGLFLGGSSEEEILLPSRHCPAKSRIGDVIQVFVYRDAQGMQMATTQEPMIHLHGFAYLRVEAISINGAFMHWGVDKDLLVPFAEQRQPMQEGRSYVVYMDLDRKTDRLFGTTKIEKHLRAEPTTLREGDEVGLMVYDRWELGWSVIVDKSFKGLVYANEAYRPLAIGDRTTGFVRAIREDHKLDISLQPIGYEHANDANTELLVQHFQRNSGFLPFTDKSDPQEIADAFGMSKKAFKKAVGALYKARLVKLEAGGIRWVDKEA